VTDQALCFILYQSHLSHRSHWYENKNPWFAIHPNAAYVHISHLGVQKIQPHTSCLNHHIWPNDNILIYMYT